MGVGPASIAGLAHDWYALIHNGATFRRDIVLAWSARAARPRRPTAPADQRQGRRRSGASGQLVVAGAEAGREPLRPRPPLAGKGRQPDALVMFDEVVDGHRVVNGFAVLAQTRPSAEVTRHLLQRALSVYTRAEAFGVREAAPGVKRARALLKGKVSDKAFVDFVRALREVDQRLQIEFAARLGTRGDPFGLAPARKGVDRRRWRRRRARAAVALRRVPRRRSTRADHADIAAGDLADICQNVRWQAELFRTKTLGAARRPSASRPAPTPSSPASPRERSRQPTTRSS